MGIHVRVLWVTLSQSMQSGLIGLWFSPIYSQIGGWSRERDVIAKGKRGVTQKSLSLSELQILKAIFFGSAFFVLLPQNYLEHKIEMKLPVFKINYIYIPSFVWQK